MNAANLSRHAAGRTAVRIAGAFLPVIGVSFAGPAGARSAVSFIDKPTPASLPPATSTVDGAGNARHEGNGQIAPPSAIQSSTDVMQSEGSVQSKSQGGRTDLVKHPPKDKR